MYSILKTAEETLKKKIKKNERAEAHREDKVAICCRLAYNHRTLQQSLTFVSN